MGRTFYLPSGVTLDIDAPKIQKFPLEDLLLLLAKEKRFYNTSDWSVLEHSLACYLAGEQLFPDNHNLLKHLLFHDLHEALIRDIPSFMKTEDFREMEDYVSGRLMEALEIEPLASEDKP